MDSNGQLIFSPVLLFLDRNSTEIREFLQITTSSGRQFLITPSHLLYALPDSTISSTDINSFINSSTALETMNNLYSKVVVTFANKVEIGDWLLIVQSNSNNNNNNNNSSNYDNNKSIIGAVDVFNNSSQSIIIIKPERVIDIQLKVEIGVYAPLTQTGTVIVNDVVSSCYAIVDSQQLAHWAFFPIRLLYNFSNSLNYLWRRISFLVTFSSITTNNSNSNNDANVLNSEQLFVNMVKNHVKSHDRDLQELNVEEQGIHWYASTLYSITSKILPRHYLYGS